MQEIIKFRSQPILRIISESDPRVKIQFGLKKASLIVSNIDIINEFIANYTNSNININKNSPSGAI